MTNSPFEYKLSVVAIMKHEQPYVLEWVAYHHVIGVDHFYIYDNEENSGMDKILAKYIEQGIVTLIPAPGDVMMFKCYNECINKYKDYSKYMAFIDADEFLVPIEDVNIADLVDKIISQYSDFNPYVAGLVAKWSIYGSGKHEKKPEGLVIENYLYKENGVQDKHVKSIVNPRKVASFSNPHFATYKNQDYAVSEKGAKVTGPFLFTDDREQIRINHYYYKSEEEFVNNRIRRGKCDIRITKEQITKKIEDELPALRNSNNEFDDIMLRYVNRVKDEMIEFETE